MHLASTPCVVQRQEQLPHIVVEKPQSPLPMWGAEREGVSTMFCGQDRSWRRQ